MNNGPTAATDQLLLTYNDLLELPWAVLVAAPDGRTMRVNRAMADLLDRSPDDCNGVELWTLLGSMTNDLEDMQRWISTIGSTQFTVVRSRMDIAVGKTRSFDVHRQVLDDSGVVLLHFLSIEPEIPESASTRLRLLERAIGSSANAIVITDAIDKRHPIIYANPAFERITGYAAAEVLGKSARFLVGHDFDQMGIGIIREALREKQEGKALVRNYRKNGELFWNELTVSPVEDGHGVVTHYVSVMQDITIRKMQEERLEWHAKYDGTTGLPNRILLLDRLQQYLYHALGGRRRIVLVAIDIDRFSMINDAYGQAVANNILRIVGQRLQDCVRQCDTVSRVGSDQFAVLLTECDTQDDAIVMVEQLRNAIEKRISIGASLLSLTASIGVSVSLLKEFTPTEIINQSEAAMHRARSAGLGMIRFSAGTMEPRARDHLEFESLLRNSVANAELVLHYQPIIDSRTGEILKLEALVRWMHPTHGFLLPGAFIPQAEDTGLIIQIGAWIIRNAVQQIALWRNSGATQLAVCINVSSRQFQNGDVCQQILAEMGRVNLTGDAIVVELTETSLMNNIDESSRAIKQLKDRGIKVAMDDFGTGYSSLAYLKRLPVDILKIDRTFVQGIPYIPDDIAIVRSILSVATAMNLQVIAEGIELQLQADFLESNGCHLMQGFLYASPTPAGTITEWLYAQRKNQRWNGKLYLPRTKT